MNTLQAEQDLALIKKIMEDSRQIVLDNGWHYIFWGLLVTIALVANYIMANADIAMRYQGMMWLILMLSGMIISVLVGIRKEKKSPVKTFAGRLLGSLWISTGIALMLIGFIGTFAKAYHPVFVSPIISVVLGISYSVSGEIQQMNWFKFISLGWWTGGILLFIFPGLHTLLIFAFMMICFQLIPGVILYRRF